GPFVVPGRRRGPGGAVTARRRRLPPSPPNVRRRDDPEAPRTPTAAQGGLGFAPSAVRPADPHGRGPRVSPPDAFTRSDASVRTGAEARDEVIRTIRRGA